MGIRTRRRMTGYIKRNRGNFFMLVILVYQIAMVYAFSLLHEAIPGAVIFEKTWVLLVLTQFLICAMPVVVVLIIRRKSAEPLRLYRPHKLGAVNFVLLLAITVCVYPISIFISYVMLYITPNTVAGMITGMNSESSLFLTFLSVAMIPAVFEETLFRGYLFAQYDSVSLKKAVVLNGVFFGLFHLNLHQLPYAFVLGVVFALLVYYSRSLSASILIHFLLNAVSVMVSFAAAKNLGEAGMTETDAAEIFSLGTFVILAGIAVIAAVGLILLMRVFIKHNRNRSAVRATAVSTHDKLEDANAATIGTDGPGRPFGMLFWIIILVYSAYMIYAGLSG